MIRFSLTTLLLVAFWIGAVMLVWVWRQPWHFVGDFEPQRSNIFVQSPDGSRVVIRPGPEWGICWCTDNAEPLPISPVFMKYEESFRLPVFINDATIQAIDPEIKSARLFCRRFPEWWWGHFYRPEVWLALALTGVLIWRGVRSRRLAQINMEHKTPA